MCAVHIIGLVGFNFAILHSITLKSMSRPVITGCVHYMTINFFEIIGMRSLGMDPVSAKDGFVCGWWVGSEDVRKHVVSVVWGHAPQRVVDYITASTNLWWHEHVVPPLKRTSIYKITTVHWNRDTIGHFQKWNGFSVNLIFLVCAMTSYFHLASCRLLARNQLMELPEGSSHSSW